MLVVRLLKSLLKSKVDSSMIFSRDFLCILHLCFTSLKICQIRVYTGDFLGYCRIDARIGAARPACGQAGDEGIFGAVENCPGHSLPHQFPIPVLPVAVRIVDTTHKSNLAAVFFQQFGNIVGAHNTLPDIYAHTDHVRNQGGGVGIGVMHDHLNAMFSVASRPIMAAASYIWLPPAPTKAIRCIGSARLLFRMFMTIMPGIGIERIKYGGKGAYVRLDQPDQQ